MTPDERAALRALADAAAPGPWERGDWHIWSKADGVSREVCGMGGWEHRDDGAFIAAAREAVPALLDALDAAEARADANRGIANAAAERAASARAALDRVRALHQPDACNDPCCTCTPDGTLAYPCATVRAIEGES